jgi:succinate dehydrogenase / fumarate reductase flavoprotein subunit
LNWELFAKDALHRNESSWRSLREEYQTADGEATRDDENFAYVAVLSRKPSDAVLQRGIIFDNVKLVTRSYK